MRERRDEAKASAGLPYPYIACGTAAAIVRLLERPALGEIRLHDAERQIMRRAVGIDLTHRHGLDEREIAAMRAGKTNEIVEFVIVDTAQRHRVDLDREARRDCRVDAGKHPIEPPKARDGGEFGGVEGIERDVHPTHAGGMKRRGVAGELTGVGGQRELVERARREVPPETLEEP